MSRGGIPPCWYHFMTKINLIYDTLINNPNTIGLFLTSHKPEVMEVFNLLKPLFIPHLTQAFLYGDFARCGFKFKNGSHLYITKYNKWSTCGVRGDFVMLSGKSLLNKEFLETIAVPLIIYNPKRNINPFVYNWNDDRYIWPLKDLTKILLDGNLE